MNESWNDVLGYAMTSYFGGRAECRIRRVAAPVVTVDFTSMYASVQTLMRLERFLTCERIDARTADTRRLMRWIRNLTPDDLFDPKTWQELPVICLVQPRPGDVLPIRARYGGFRSAFGIGVNTWAEAPSEPLWYTLPDVVAAYLLSGQVPKILRAIRFVPVGQAPSLRSMRLRGEVEVDPQEGRFFASVVERRAALPKDEQKVGLGRFLKVFASSTSYGVFAEMNRHERANGKLEEIGVFGLRSFEVPSVPETPGAFFFAPTAALVTGAARLMLALLEHEVISRGGTYAFCDTDSMAIIACRRGRTLTIDGAGAYGVAVRQRLRAISWADVRQIVLKFDRLNPYATVEHLLKVEDENHEAGQQRELLCFAVSAKRYCLFVLDEAGQPKPITISDADDEAEDESLEGANLPSVVKRSEHGLGHLLNPYDPDDIESDWIEEAWSWILASELDPDVERPWWFELPAVSRTSVSTPSGLVAFEGLNHWKPADEQVRPFNFLLVCYPDRLLGLPAGADPTRFRLVAPYERDSSKWVRVKWYEAHTGEGLRITTHGAGGDGYVRVKTYGEIVEDYRLHEESKSVGPDLQPCGKRTIGLLGRRAVVVRGKPRHLGKESNKLEDRLYEQVDTEANHLNVLNASDWSDFRQIVVPAGIALRDTSAIAELAGVSQRVVQKAFAGGGLRATTERRMTFAIDVLLKGARATDGLASNRHADR
jgi:hypothetical protein